MKFQGSMPMRLAWLNWPAGARWILTFVYWGIVNWLMFMPANKFPDIGTFPMQDKIGHLVIFGILAALVRWSVPERWSRGRRCYSVIMMLVAYGFGTEYIQSLSPCAGRMFEWADILMDCIGVVMGMWMCGRLAGRR